MMASFTVDDANNIIGGAVSASLSKSSSTTSTSSSTSALSTSSASSSSSSAETHVFRILPKDLCALSACHGPLFFLAGPLTGGGDWQSRMCDALLEFFPMGFTVAIPYGLLDKPLADHPPFSKFSVLEATEHTERQLPWERRYLDLAAGVPTQGGIKAPGQGCVVFWLPVESTRYPKPPIHGPYAMDTRGELGEWRGRLIYDRSLRVVVGGDKHFPGFSCIERNFKYALGDDYKVHRTMRDTAAAVFANCQSKAEGLAGNP